MKKTLVIPAILLAVSGCSKVDSDICWRPETKDSVQALVTAQKKPLSDGVRRAFEVQRIEVFFGNIDVKPSTSGFVMDKIDQESGVAECSADLTVEARYNASAKLQNTGKIRFSSKLGEHGRYIDLNKEDITPVALGIH